ncbi:MAG: hypothetical protein C5B51_26780 [Terriglobia bacterium]|nr:MAG: hypothetical protein C5B51_26780 [Terriglobia bacterium]
MPAAACIFFFFAGLAFLPHLGIENDEALFATAFYKPGTSEEYVIRLSHSRLPLMLINYLGTLKSWIYRPLFRLWGTSVASIRIPVLLAGVTSLWLFYLLLRRVAGKRAALVGCGLLATDSTYLLTTCFDWGPVALQHLLLIGGAFSLVLFWQEGKQAALAAGFFLFGLALWDKAVAFWMLSGLAVASAVILPRQILDRVTVRRLGIAILALVLGALPLIAYNLRSGWGTLHGTAKFDASDLKGKARALEGVLRGEGLLGWMIAEDWQSSHQQTPRSTLERASIALAGATGKPRRNLFFYAFCAALLLATLARGAALRAILFALITMTTAWFEMALTAGAGGGVHHIVLLWPLPQVIVAISFAAVCDRLGRAARPVLACVSVLVILSGLAVLNQQYAQLVRNGGAIAWTDAVFPLTESLESSGARSVFCLDWGFLDAVRVLSSGVLPVRVGSEQLSKPEWAAEDRSALKEMISNPENIFVAHTREFEYYSGLSARLLNFARGAGYERATVSFIADSHGRTTFEIYRFRGP